MKPSLITATIGQSPARRWRMPQAAMLLCSSLLMAWPLPGAAQGPAEATASVLVSGADLPWRPYTAMRPALAAFAQDHALAPEAEVRFLLRPQTGARLAGLRLELALDADTRIYLPVMADGTFSLPDHPGARAAAALALNRPATEFRWRPSVRSPDVPAGARRLGDLRLECRMLWALEQATPPAPQPVWPGSGPCQAVAADASDAASAAGAAAPVAFPAPHPLAGTTIVAGAKRSAVRQDASGSRYYPPLTDATWPDSALLYFESAAPRE